MDRLLLFFNKFILKTKSFFAKNLANNKYLLQDKHTFKPMLIEIEDRPVNPVGHFILWAIVTVFAIAIIWLSVSEIDVVVTGRGKLVPSGDVKTIQATYNGVIKNIVVKEGQNVKKGDLLVQIDTNIINSQLEGKNKELDSVLLKIERLNALIKEKTFLYTENMNKTLYLDEKDLFDNEKNGLAKRLLVIEGKIEENRQKIKISTLEKLSKQSSLKFESQREKKLKKVIDIIAKMEYEKTYFKVISLKTEIKSYENRINVFKNNLKELEHQKKLIKATANSKYYTELIEAIKRKDKLVSEIKTITLQKYKYDIVSPVDGYVLKLDINTKDGVVTPAQKLLTIVPKDVKILAKVDIQNKDIGYLTNTMNCLLKIDTFDFQKYGFIDANVKNISTSSIEKEKIGLVYEVLLEVHKDHFIYNGEKRLLKPGMSITSEMKVGKRKLIEFFIYPAIKYLHEGMSIR